MESAAQNNSKVSYGYWRTDVAKEEGFSHEFISSDTEKLIKATNATLETLDGVEIEGVDTILKAFKRNVTQMPDHPWLGTRVVEPTKDEYQWVTFKECDDIVENLSYGIVALGLAPQVEADGQTWQFMGIQAKNRKEWVYVHLANMHQSLTTVAFYDTLGQDATKFMLEQTELTTIAVSFEFVKSYANMKIEDAKLDPAQQRMHRLKNLIVFESTISEEDRKLAEEAGIALHTLEEVIKAGRESQTKTLNEPGPDSTLMFSYTSGTTGDPKGVKLTHKMVLGVQYAVNQRLDAKPPSRSVTKDDCYISYLPAAHSFEQAVFGMAVATGMKVGFFSGNVQKITEDLVVLKPTFFPSVPRLFNRIYGKIQDKFKEATGLKGSLVKRALNSKLYYLRRDGTFTHKFYDVLVFNKVKALLGGRVRIMITGSAPIATDVLDFLKVAFCAPICEGYGMTESCGGSATTYAEDPESGHVGGPLQNVKIRLRDIPEMQYFSTDQPNPRGEICFWGPSVMKGYFKNPEKTAEAFHGEWLCSGDVGMVLPNGALKIFDRAKNIFKLSQGEYIAPEKIENVFIQSEWVLQIWIHGDSLHDWIVAFVVLDPDRLKKYTKETGKEVTDESLQSDELKLLVLKDLIKLANENKFSGLEKPKQITLLKEQFSQDNDLLTPTMKLKRNVAKKYFEESVKTMYSLPPMNAK